MDVNVVVEWMHCIVKSLDWRRILHCLIAAQACKCMSLN